MQTTLVATLTTPPSEDGAELAALSPDVGVLEVRADLLGELDPEWLRERFPGELLYTLRSRAEGGSAEGSQAERQALLAAAAERYDLVDLESQRDLTAEILDAIPAQQRLLSWHGLPEPLAALEARLMELSGVPARYYKLIPIARQPLDGVRPLALLHKSMRKDVVTFAAGEAGAWTRPLAPRFGCPLIYGALGNVAGAPGQLSVERLRRDYGLPHLKPADALYGIVGNPVLHSLSPRLHNGAYRHLGLPAVYVPFHAESFGDLWIEIVEGGHLEALGLPLRGLSVTAPHKDVALAVSGASSPRAQHIAAANTLTRSAEGVWEAETTDPEGVLRTFVAGGVELKGARAAVVGAGGAGKAAAYGLEMGGAEVTLVNRGEERGMKAASELGMPFEPLGDFDPAAWDVIVQATALGHRPEDPTPFASAAVRPDAAVVDLVYGNKPTRLVHELRERGVRAWGGRPVLLYQALKQFRCHTGQELPEDLARELLGMPTGAPDAAPSHTTPAENDTLESSA